MSQAYDIILDQMATASVAGELTVAQAEKPAQISNSSLVLIHMIQGFEFANSCDMGGVASGSSSSESSTSSPVIIDSSQDSDPLNPQTAKLQAMLNAATALGDLMSDVLNSMQREAKTLSDNSQAMLVALQNVLTTLIAKIQELEAEQAKASKLSGIMKIVSGILAALCVIVAVVTANPVFLFLAAVMITFIAVGDKINDAVEGIFKSAGCSDDLAKVLGAVLIAAVIAVCTAGIGAAEGALTGAENLAAVAGRSAAAGFINGAVQTNLPTSLLLLIPFIKSQQDTLYMTVLMTALTLVIAVVGSNFAAGQASESAAEGKGLSGAIAKSFPRVGAAVEEINKSIIAPVTKALPKLTYKVVGQVLQAMAQIAQTVLLGLMAQNNFNMADTQKAKAATDPELATLNAVVSANNESQELNTQNGNEMLEMLNKAITLIGQYFAGMEAENQTILEA